MTDASPHISYCIPVMTRGGDLRATLDFNLRENRVFGRHVEFVVMFFDDHWQTHDWVRSNFADDLERGYLRVVASALPYWHFGRAKTAFRHEFRGKVYSSLDADNFVTRAQTLQLLGVLATEPGPFVFHHFSGVWGDGSSGRVSVSRDLYLSVGYDASLLPRQYDELDMIISTLSRHPHACLVRHDTQKHVLSSPRATRFATESGVASIRHWLVPQVDRRPALNPNGEGYLKRSGLLRAMNDFNQQYCFWKNSSDPEARTGYLKSIYRQRRELVAAMPREQLIPVVVSPQGGGKVRPCEPDDVCLFTCIKDDEIYLQEFYAHYKRLGVTRFFVVDDGSRRPVSQTLPHPDVHVFDPQVGNFQVAKAIWIEALIRHFVPPGTWVVTVDCDEFLDLGAYGGAIAPMVKQLEVSGRSILPALLVDMLPGGSGDSFLDRFTHHCLHPADPASSYSEHQSIRSGFGEFARLSWMLDARYHAFGTFDSLRKIPLFRCSPSIFLNQGFHDLRGADGSRPWGPDVWSSGPVVPVRHYKLAKLSSERQCRSVLDTLGRAFPSYHPRTALNMAAIFGGGSRAGLERLARVPRVLYSVQGFEAITAAGRSPGYRIADAPFS